MDRSQVTGQELGQVTWKDVDVPSGANEALRDMTSSFSRSVLADHPHICFVTREWHTLVVLSHPCSRTFR